MMLGKDKATVFYQALELLHSADSESEKKLHGLLTEASNNFGNFSVCYFCILMTMTNI